MGAGGEEDPEAWEQWFGYVDWILAGQPDDLEHARIMDSDDEDYQPAADEAD